MYIDRPQKYSNTVPALYGFIPQTFSAKKVAEFCMEKTGRDDIQGDLDPIGKFRMIDGNQSDDKIIAVLNNEAVYGNYKDIGDCPLLVIDRLKHYFLTYKDLPGNPRDVEITHTFGIDEAHEIIRRSMEDYHHKFDNLTSALSDV